MAEKNEKEYRHYYTLAVRVDKRLRIICVLQCIHSLHAVPIKGASLHGCSILYVIDILIVTNNAVNLKGKLTKYHFS